jgi:hypothetical protein
MKYFEKISGVGFDIHGYSASPEELDSFDKRIKEIEKLRKKEVGEFPSRKETIKGPLSFLGIGKKVRESWESHRERPDVKAYYDKGRKFNLKYDKIYDDASGFRSKKRIKTKFDKDVSYKLQGYLSGSGNWGDYTSDNAYSKEEIIKNLSKKTVKNKILPLYEKELDAYKKYYKNKGDMLNLKDADKYGKGFINKTKDLLNNPKVKTIRLEWE